jgi:hypothetical protein
MADSWVGFELDDLAGDRVGSVHSLYLDVDSGTPVWLVAGLGGRRQSKAIAIPYANCAAGAGRVWAAHHRDVLREAPGVDPTRPLLREHELAICSHYGISERIGRAAAVVERDEGTLTARPG